VPEARSGAAAADLIANLLHGLLLRLLKRVAAFGLSTEPQAAGRKVTWKTTNECRVYELASSPVAASRMMNRDEQTWLCERLAGEHCAFIRLHSEAACASRGIGGPNGVAESRRRSIELRGELFAFLSLSCLPPGRSRSTASLNRQCD
jgi:hypothetical protein